MRICWLLIQLIVLTTASDQSLISNLNGSQYRNPHTRITAQAHNRLYLKLNEKEESGERFGQMFLDHLPELTDVHHQYHASHPLVTSLIPR
jgi:hypothetical protein